MFFNIAFKQTKTYQIFTNWLEVIKLIDNNMALFSLAEYFTQPPKQVVAIEEKAAYIPSANPLEQIQKLRMAMRGNA